MASVVRLILPLMLYGGVQVTAAAEEATPPAPSARERAEHLVARYANEADQIVGSPFGRPISVNSAAREGVAYGEAIAELPLAMPVLRAVLDQPQRWCEILLLTPNIAGCATVGQPGQGHLEVQWLARFDQPRDEATRAVFHFQREIADERFYALRLRAPSGPFGTSAYRLDVDVAPLDDHRSVLRVSYGYRYGLKALATVGLYLSTSGRRKLGFSVDARQRPIRGIRGSVERNVMRFLLAIEAHAVQDSRDPLVRFPASLDRWLDAVDVYPERIAEPDRSAYRRIKLAHFGTAQ